MMRQINPMPEVGQWWRFDCKQSGRVKHILPGGSGDLGIVEFDGPVPSAHVATMLRFAAWRPCKPGEIPTVLEAPCTCITLDGGVMLSDGCARHGAANTKDADMPALEAST